MKMSAIDIRQSQSFMERFRGRITLINKEGDYGVVANARLPIQKLQQSDILDIDEYETSDS